MSNSKLLHWKEAGEVMNSISNPILERLVARATTIALKKYRSEASSLSTDLDIKFFTEVIVELFADLDVIRKELSGERPGAWFDDESMTQQTCLTPNSDSPTSTIPLPAGP